MDMENLFGTLIDNVTEENPSNVVAQVEDGPLDGSFLEIIQEQEVETSKTYECSICEKNFKHRSSLKRHLKSHDSGYSFECKKCTLFFHTDVELNEHNMKTHVKKLLCIACGKRFERQANLDTHTRVFHPTTYLGDGESKIRVCPFDGCTRVFDRESKYQDHLNKHSGMRAHACPHCGRSYWNRYQKKSHEKICSGLVSFMCNTCNLQFIDKSALKKHQNAKHLGVVYTCTDCGRKFAYLSSLSRHRKGKHGEILATVKN